MYFIEYPQGKKFNLMKLDKEQLSKINETKAQILEVLRDKKGLYSAKMIQKRLKERGIDFRIDNIRYHLNELTEINLVDKIIPTKGTENLEDPRAQYFYKINPEYIGFYFTYFPKEAKYIEQNIPEGRQDLLEILDINVLNKEGDAVISEFYIFENTGDTPINSNRHSVYTDEGSLKFNEIELEVFDINGNKLKVEPIESGGRHQVEFMVNFKPIKKGEVYSYWLKRKRNGAFPIEIQHIYRDTIWIPAKLLVISIVLQEEIKGIKKMSGFFKTEKIPERLETPIKPFSYLENSRVKILWYVRETVFGSTYTLEWEPKV